MPISAEKYNALPEELRGLIGDRAYELSSYDAGYTPENPINEMHPDLSLGDRLKVSNFGTPEASKRYLEQRGFEVVPLGYSDFALKKGGGSWYKLEKSGPDIYDLLDIGGDVAVTAAEVGGAVGGVAAGLFGTGGLASAAAGAAGAGMAGAAAEAARVGVGKLFGLDPTLGEGLASAATEGVVGATGSVLGDVTSAGIRKLTPFSAKSVVGMGDKDLVARGVERGVIGNEALDRLVGESPDLAESLYSRGALSDEALERLTKPTGTCPTSEEFARNQVAPQMMEYAKNEAVRTAGQFPRGIGYYEKGTPERTMVDVLFDVQGDVKLGGRSKIDVLDLIDRADSEIQALKVKKGTHSIEKWYEESPTARELQELVGVIPGYEPYRASGLSLHQLEGGSGEGMSAAIRKARPNRGQISIEEWLDEKKRAYGLNPKHSEIKAKEAVRTYFNDVLGTKTPEALHKEAIAFAHGDVSTMQFIDDIFNASSAVKQKEAAKQAARIAGAKVTSAPTPTEAIKGETKDVVFELLEKDRDEIAGALLGEQPLSKISKAVAAGSQRVTSALEKVYESLGNFKIPALAGWSFLPGGAKAATLAAGATYGVGQAGRLAARSISPLSRVAAAKGTPPFLRRQISTIIEKFRQGKVNEFKAGLFVLLRNPTFRTLLDQEIGDASTQ